jgi:hypothetical protein
MSPRVRAPGSDGRGCYEVRLAGQLDPHWSAWFGGMTLTHEDDGTTSLRGVVADQAQLHGVLGRVRDLGVTLLSVHRTASTGDDDGRHPAEPSQPAPTATRPARSSQP